MLCLHLRMVFAWCRTTCSDMPGCLMSCGFPLTACMSWGACQCCISLHVVLFISLHASPHNATVTVPWVDESLLVKPCSCPAGLCENRGSQAKQARELVSMASPSGVDVSWRHSVCVVCVHANGWMSRWMDECFKVEVVVVVVRPIMGHPAASLTEVITQRYSSSWEDVNDSFISNGTLSRQYSPTSVIYFYFPKVLDLALHIYI